MAKHGNRSATSQSGSADVLEALGARIDLEPEGVAACIDEVGFGFMFAPKHHAAMKHVVPIRRELGVRTIFNFLGPLTNPAGARHQVIGVSDPSKLETMAAALGELGTRTALVVSSTDGLDEFSVSGATRVVELRDGRLASYEVNPAEVGLEQVGDGAVRAGTPGRERAGIARRAGRRARNRARPRRSERRRRDLRGRPRGLDRRRRRAGRAGHRLRGGRRGARSLGRGHTADDAAPGRASSAPRARRSPRASASIRWPSSKGRSTWATRAGRSPRRCGVPARR